MAQRRSFLTALLLGLSASPAWAVTSLGGDWTTGLGYRGYDVKGSLNLDSKGVWEGNVTYSYAHSTVGTESRSHQLVLGFSHVLSENWNSRASLTGWRDTLNNIQYVGPSFGFSYTALQGNASIKGPARELFKISFDSEIFVYKADETNTFKTIVIANQPVVVPPGSSVTLAQWHPTFQFEMPAWDGRLVPSVSAGHYLYSKNPSLIQQRAGQPHFSASANSINGLVGGMLLNNGQVGLDFNLPLNLKLSATLGSEQLSSDNTWATIQGLGASIGLLDLCRATFNWNRSIQGGQTQDLSTAGLTWWF